MSWQIVWLLLGLFYGAVLEYSIHRFLFHGRGKRRGSRFSFHWHEHHSASRRQRMMDPSYQRWVPRWDAHGREVLGLGLLGLLHLPLAPVSPGFFLGAMIFGGLYHYVHSRCHTDLEWALARCPWHVQHHLGGDQDQNFGVVTDLIDRLVGTRVDQPIKPRASAGGRS